MPDEVSLTYGPLLLEQKHPVLRKYLEFSLELKEGLVARLQDKASGEQAQVRIRELQGEISVIKELLS